MSSSETAPIAAVLFDVDGTLVDSNYLHIASWMRALHDLGRDVDAVRIHRGLGMDSQQLLADLLGDDADEVGPRASDLHGKYYRRAAKRLRAFDGAAPLLAELQGRGIRVVLATSAPQDELELLLAALQVDADSLILTHADDVETAKPDPGIVHVALDRAGVTAADAIFVGDSVWDMKTARTAGVRTIGVLSGGIGADELREGGADQVVESVARLRDPGAGWLARLPS